MAKYAVRRISLGSTLKFGFVLGALLSLVPSLLCGLAGSWTVSTAYQIMDGWRDVRLEILGQPVRFDLIDLLKLEGLLEQLRFLDQNDWLFALLLVLVACCVTALVLGLSANLLTLGYNVLAWLTGGLVIELRELDDSRRRREITVEHIERPRVPREEEPQLLEATHEPVPVAREEDQQLLEAAIEYPITPPGLPDRGLSADEKALDAGLSSGLAEEPEEQEPEVGLPDGGEEDTYTET